MRIIGIDPGLANVGWGVIDYVGNSPKHIANGSIKTPSKMKFPDRLAKIYTDLEQIITLWQPNEAAVEETFVNPNPNDALKLSQARGICVCVPARLGLPTAEYAPNKIKKTVVGSGHAQKQQVQLMINMLMPGVQLNSPDAADALAIAICHAHNRGALDMAALAQGYK